MRTTLDMARRLAPLLRPVLLVGPSGVGKGLLARFMHAQSGRPGAFVALAGGELAESLYPDQLAGHVRGAFTGAWQGAAGVFERAHHGTLLIDELPLWPRAGQSALLRSVDEGLITPLGAGRSLAVTCRLLFASTRPLTALVEEGSLLPDLRWRIGEFVIEVPPLVGRAVDIAQLAYHFLDLARAEFDTRGPDLFDPEALDHLLTYAWPGNVRQLKSVVEWSVVQASATDAERIAVGHLPVSLADPARPRVALGVAARRALSGWAFARVGGSRLQAAALLGVHPNTIDRHLRATA